MNHFEYLGRILGVRPSVLKELDREMGVRTHKVGILEKVAEENEVAIKKAVTALGCSGTGTLEIKNALRKKIASGERGLLDFLKTEEGSDEFERATRFARKLAKTPKGFFLKRDRGEEILRKRVPPNLITFLGASDIEEVLRRYDIVEIFSALRFIESEAWMHETFEAAYSNFTKKDFEEREIEVRVLGPEWRKVAEAFVTKKHHNVSHLKEFGVIFLNPIKENVPGKFLRDFALLLHYFHEIDFYSKLFRRYSKGADFSSRLKELLRGDVKEVDAVQSGEWLIVQRYLAKENPNDPRLFLPRVNPESLHWLRGERDLVLFKTPGAKLDFSFWENLDWVGGILKDDEKIISFDLEDNVMSLVSHNEGKNEIFYYHQREAMWTRIFEEYAGGEEGMEKLLLDNFDNGIIRF